MSPLDITHGALVLLGALILLLWAIPSPCRCDHCGFHTNERRMKALRQAELNHDYAHKGPGFEDGSPDIQACNDETCPRNPKQA